MAKGRSGGRQPRRDASSRRPSSAKGSSAKGSSAKGSSAKGSSAPQTKRTPSPSPAPSPAPSAPATFRLGAIPGTTPGRWIDVWKQRMPHTSLELTPVAVADQRRVIVADEVDAALVRLPIDRDGLHAIPLYDEVTVVVCARESHLTAAEELDPDDLAGEVLIVPQDDVLGIRPQGTVPARFAPPADTGEAIAVVVTGVGIVVVPMSLARLHHRKDVEYRPLRGAAPSTVALAWAADRTTPAVETFVGIVRGRTANSSRG